MYTVYRAKDVNMLLIYDGIILLNQPYKAWITDCLHII